MTRPTDEVINNEKNIYFRQKKTDQVLKIRKLIIQDVEKNRTDHGFDGLQKACLI